MDPVRFVYDYQTLITGVLAVLAAIATIFFLHRQIAQSDRHHAENLERRLRAAKASLPVALAEVCSYAEGCVRFLRDPHTHIPSALVASSADVPAFPSEALRIIGEAIEVAADDDAKKLSHLVALSQIQNSRFFGTLRSYGGESGRGWSATQIAQGIRDAIKIYKHADRVFPYARGDVNSMPELADAEAARNTLRVVFNIRDDALLNAILRNWDSGEQRQIVHSSGKA